MKNHEQDTIATDIRRQKLIDKLVLFFKENASMEIDGLDDSLFALEKMYLATRATAKDFGRKVTPLPQLKEMQ